MHDAGVGGERGELDAGLRRGEVEHAVGLGEQLRRIVGDRHAELAEPGQQAGVLHRARARPLLRRADQRARLLACTARTSSRPMRPAAPITAIFISLMCDPQDALAGGIAKDVSAVKRFRSARNALLPQSA